MWEHLWIVLPFINIKCVHSDDYKTEGEIRVASPATQLFPLGNQHSVAEP